MFYNMTLQELAKAFALRRSNMMDETFKKSMEKLGISPEELDEFTTYMIDKDPPREMLNWVRYRFMYDDRHDIVLHSNTQDKKHHIPPVIFDEFTGQEMSSYDMINKYTQDVLERKKSGKLIPHIKDLPPKRIIRRWLLAGHEGFVEDIINSFKFDNPYSVFNWVSNKILIQEEDK